MPIQGTLNRGIIVLDQPAPWPEGTRVEVLVRTADEKKPTLSERLPKHALTVPDKPTGAVVSAGEHDHYIHGTPKRSERAG